MTHLTENADSSRFESGIFTMTDDRTYHKKILGKELHNKIIIFLLSLINI